MGKEIERKFLIAPEVDPAAWKAGPPGTLMRQGYLSTVPDRTVRVRTAGERAMLTIKGKTEPTWTALSASARVHQPATRGQARPGTRSSARNIRTDSELVEAGG